MPLALIHATTGEAESQAHLREAANQLAIPIEKHIVWSKSESAQALLSAAEQADIELLVAGALRDLRSIGGVSLAPPREKWWTAPDARCCSWCSHGSTHITSAVSWFSPIFRKSQR